MNSEDPYRDQAERLRKKIVRKRESAESSTEKEILSPRSRLHREKRKKNKWKLKNPLISLLALCFILLPIAIYSMSQSWGIGKTENAEKASKNESGFETVGFENQNDKKSTTIEEREEIPKSDDKPPGKDKESNSSIPAEKSPIEDEPNDKGSVSPDENQAKADGKSDQEKTGKSQDEKAVVYHTVKTNETLYRIAMKYFNSQSGIEIIKKANNLNSNEIQVGQVLAIPKN